MTCHTILQKKKLRLIVSVLTRYRAGIQTLEIIFQILHPENNTLLLLSFHHSSLQFLPHPLLFSCSSLYSSPFPFSMSCAFFTHSFLSLPLLFVGDLLTLISHPFSYPLHPINSIFPNPASFSTHDISSSLPAVSPNSRPHLLFFASDFLTPVPLRWKWPQF